MSIKEKVSIVIKRLSKHFGKSYIRQSYGNDILDILIATKLSQNTTDRSSYKAYMNLKSKFPKWKDVADATVEEIKDLIKVCGLSNTKAKDIKEMLNEMLAKHGNLDFSFIRKFEDDKVYEEFLQYKGIGVKTISCVLAFGLGRDAIPVDTHVHRVLNRLGIVRTNSPEKTFSKANELIPKGRKFELHSNLIRFGRNICRAKNPLCSICFLYDVCVYKEKKLFRKKLVNGTKENNFIILEHI